MKIVSMSHAKKQVRKGHWRKVGTVLHDDRRYTVYEDLLNQETRHAK